MDRKNFVELLQTIKRNRLKNVWPQNIALGESVGTCRFVRPKDIWGSFMYGPTFNSQKADVAILDHFDLKEITFYESAVTTLDEFFRVHSLDRLDLVKVDVDGPELLILRGGIRIITKYKPVFIVESPFYDSRYGSTFKDIWDFFKQFGYDIYAAMRLNDQMKYIKEPDDLYAYFSKQGPPDIMCFCYLPDVHRQRWRSLWFMTP